MFIEKTSIAKMSNASFYEWRGRGRFTRIEFADANGIDRVLELDGHEVLTPSDYFFCLDGDRRVLSFAKAPDWEVAKTSKATQTLICIVALSWIVGFGVIKYRSPDLHTEVETRFSLFGLAMFALLPAYGLWSIWRKRKAEQLLESFIAAEAKRH